MPPRKGIPIPKRPHRVTEGAVYIEWLDSCSVHGWEHPDRINPEPFVRCETIGFILREDERGIQVVSTRHADRTGSVCQQISIPRISILKVVKL